MPRENLRARGAVQHQHQYDNKERKKDGRLEGGRGKYCKRIHLHGYEPVNRNNKAYMTSVMEMQSCGSAAHTDFTVIQSWENPDGIKA